MCCRACAAVACSWQEAKFRQLRLGPSPPPKIQAAVLDVSGALDFLKACGFEVHADAADSPEPGTWAYFLDDAQLSHVESGLSQLQLAMAQQTETQPQAQPPAQGVAAAEPGSSSLAAVPTTTQKPATTAATAAAAANAQAPIVARNTLVLLPAAPDADVPEWFFERTAAEVKAEFMSLLRQRQAKQVVASKAWKDLKLGASSSSNSRQPTAITLRVRFPEVCHVCFIHVATGHPLAAAFKVLRDMYRCGAPPVLCVPFLQMGPACLLLLHAGSQSSFTASPVRHIPFQQIPCCLMHCPLSACCRVCACRAALVCVSL